MTIRESLEDVARRMDAYAQAGIKIKEALEIINSVELTTKYPDLSHLTPREHEIYKLLGEGLEMRAIAEKLGKSLKTIEAQRDTLRKKLGFATSYELTRAAQGK